MIDIFLVALGGAAGALTRLAASQLIRSESFPWATVTVNVIGSFILGLVLFGPATGTVLLVVGIGFCGALTTFSTFSVKTVILWEADRPGASLSHAFGTFLAGLGAFTLAWLLIDVLASF